MLILTPQQVRELDGRVTAELGLPSALLMETAGRAIAQAIVDRVGPAQDRFIAVLCGTGNNGGDGFVAARVLHNFGFRLDVTGAGDPSKMTEETALHYRAMLAVGIECRWHNQAPHGQILQGIRRSLGRACAIVDALVGIGPETELREPLKTFAAQMDGRYRAFTVAADIPSGLHAGTGQVLGSAVKCHLVVTMVAAKAGLYLGQGPDHWQKLQVVDIGVPNAWLQKQQPTGQLLDADRARALLPVRPHDGHKGTFGHVFVVAGSPGKAGAAMLASGAALRTGVGLCTLGTSGEIRAHLEGSIVDVMVEAIRGGASEIKRIEKLIVKKSAIVCGPGLGTGAAEFDLVARLISLSNVPILLDADALHALAQKPEIALPAANRLVLTPHPGEMAALTGETIEQIQSDRLQSALKAARKWQAVIVLKGHHTLVAAPDGNWAICLAANTALAKGGSGDVLAGTIGGLLAQGIAAFAAAQLGVAAHSLAGQAMADKSGARGATAAELVQFLGDAWRELEHPAAA